MKRIVKVIALTLCAAMLCVSLCSCQYLDDVKARAAYYTDNSATGFTFMGHTYRIIMPQKSYQQFIIDDSAFDNTCHVSTDDVPVLMVASHGDQMTFNTFDEIPTVIMVFTNHVYENEFLDFYQDSYLHRYYVLEEEYDRIAKLLREDPIDRYFTRIYRYGVDQPWDGRTDVSLHLLDEATTAAVNRTLKEGELTDWRTLRQYDCYTVALYPCDPDMLITNGKSYTLVTDSVDFYLCDDMNYALKKVSQEDHELIRKLYSVNRDSAGYADISWYAEMYDDLQR